MDNTTRPNLIEPGVKFFLKSTLKECNKFREKNYTIIYNIALGIGFLVVVSLILYFKYKGHITPEQQSLRLKKEKEYIMTKLVQISDFKRKSSQNLIYRIFRRYGINQVLNSQWIIMGSLNNNPPAVAIPDALPPLIFFSIITFMYAAFRYINTKVAQLDTDKSIKPNDAGIIWTIIYVLVLIIGNYFINLNIASALCGSVQWTNTMFNTIIPWVFVFASIIVLLMLLPSWLSPFSNTIGYFIAKVMGLTELFNLLLKPQAVINGESQIRTPATPGNEIVSENLQKIYSDRSLLINEITQTNFNNFWNNLQNGGLLRSDETSQKNQDANKIALFNFIVLKDCIAEFIWYLLTGLLVTSISYNYIINSTCTANVKQMTENYKAETIQNQKNQENKNTHTYSTTIQGNAPGQNQIAATSIAGVSTDSTTQSILNTQTINRAAGQNNQSALGAHS